MAVFEQTMKQNKFSTLLKLLTITSRINRRRHLTASLFWMATFFLPALLIFSFLDPFSGNLQMSAFVEFMVDAFLVISMSISVINLTVLTIKRLHDFDLSAWAALPVLIPVLGMIWGLAIFFIPGSKSSNKYGPPAIKWRAKDSLFLLMTIIIIIAVFSFLFKLSKTYSSLWQPEQTQSQEETSESDSLPAISDLPTFGKQ